MIIDIQPKVIETAIRNLRTTARELAEHHNKREGNWNHNARDTVQWQAAKELAAALKNARATARSSK